MDGCEDDFKMYIPISSLRSAFSTSEDGGGVGVDWTDARRNE